jgi:phosphatidylglycerophosphate synthase
MRLVAGLLFATIAFQRVPLAFPVALYSAAMVSDLVDGLIARRGKAQSHFGRVLDLISDKSLTIVSLLFAAACAVPIFPLAFIGVREIVMLGARLITVGNRQVLATNRLFGGLMAAMLWGNTLALLIWRGMPDIRRGIEGVYWVSALIFMINLAGRIWESARRIKASVEDGAE